MTSFKGTIILIVATQMCVCLVDLRSLDFSTKFGLNSLPTFFKNTISVAGIQVENIYSFLVKTVPE